MPFPYEFKGSRAFPLDIHRDHGPISMLYYNANGLVNM